MWSIFDGSENDDHSLNRISQANTICITQSNRSSLAKDFTVLERKSHATDEILPKKKSS